MEKDSVESDFKVVIIGGSAGSLQVLMRILPELTTIKSYALIIVLHRKNSDDSTLEELIALKTKVKVKEVEDKVAVLPGFIYVAPSDYHLLFEKTNVLSLDISEKINYSRPSIDVSFQSAAEVYQSNLTGILLSGANADGTQGLIAIKNLGGHTIVQDPLTAEVPFMPNHATENATIDEIRDIDGLKDYLLSLNR
ncbi:MULTISPECIES: chemotaxis protein CheB [unclassified Flavobacterium]|uniref:chemotaxis protein CheB n=1 Tax=unclassified Flavobacterium TaxID=196869 RepID=UPI003F93BD52